jgi:hypothetical protein
LGRKSPVSVQVGSPAADRKPDSHERYSGRGPDAAVGHAYALLRGLAAGERSEDAAHRMALAVIANAPHAQQLAARVHLQVGEPTDDAMRLAGLLSQLGSKPAARVLKALSVGRWESELAEAIVEEVLTAAPIAVQLAAQVLSPTPHSWRRAIELADEVTQQQRDAHARSDRRSKVKGYAATTRKTGRS